MCVAAVVSLEHYLFLQQEVVLCCASCEGAFGRVGLGLSSMLGPLHEEAKARRVAQVTVLQPLEFYVFFEVLNCILLLFEMCCGIVYLCFRI
jgi:hypothetical protein